MDVSLGTNLLLLLLSWLPFLLPPRAFLPLHLPPPVDVVADAAGAGAGAGAGAWAGEALILICVRDGCVCLFLAITNYLRHNLYGNDVL